MAIDVGSDWVSITRPYLHELYDKVAKQRRTILSLLEVEQELSKSTKAMAELLQGVVSVESEDRLLHAVVGLPDVVPMPDGAGCPPHDPVDNTVGYFVFGQGRGDRAAEGVE